MVWSRKCKQTMDHIIHLIPRILDNGYMAIFHKIKRDYQIPMKQWLIEWRLVWIVLTDLNITDSSLDPSHTHRALTERKSRVVICIDLWWEEINIWLGLSQNTLGIDLSQKTQRHLAPHICRELGGDYQMMESWWGMRTLFVWSLQTETLTNCTIRALIPSIYYTYLMSEKAARQNLTLGKTSHLSSR